MMELENFLKEFGRQLKTKRKQMGLSQVTAAQNMRIDYRHYQNIEGGKINLRLDTLIKLVRFYNLDKAGRPFSLDGCLDLLATDSKTIAPVSGGEDNWSLLYHHFVEGGHAGYITLNSRSKLVENINAKLVESLGYRNASDITGQSLQNLMAPENAATINEFIVNHEADGMSKPFIVTLRAHAPAFAIPMMTVMKSKEDKVGGDDRLECIFFDRKTLEDEGYRLKEIMLGYQQFMDLIPQLKVV